ncbi:hypothetical protein BDFB_007971 [Asbolus verrucosus]|uniref:Uncharacterized protein n=1 Tax=Asbolus verrucosus TaxID=1661398 RepID=A0A482VBZ2_ASBVE|nr:hypothetical protein BDFB_007971 [Asbolus verrucosus]
MTVNDYKETACATAGQEDMEVDSVIQPQQVQDSENLLGRVLAGQRCPVARLVHCPSAFQPSRVLSLSIHPSSSRALTFNSTNSPRFKDPCQRIEPRGGVALFAAESAARCGDCIEVGAAPRRG